MSYLFLGNPDRLQNYPTRTGKKNSLYIDLQFIIFWLYPSSQMPIEMLDFLFTPLSQYNFDSFILTDSNIDLLSLNHNNLSSKYFNLSEAMVFLKSFINLRFFSQNNHSLIDHMLAISHASSFISGVLTQDKSEHWFTFCSINLKKEKAAQVAKSARSFLILIFQNFMKAFKLYF